MLMLMVRDIISLRLEFYISVSINCSIVIIMFRGFIFFKMIYYDVRKLKNFGKLFVLFFNF